MDCPELLRLPRPSKLVIGNKRDNIVTELINDPAAFSRYINP